MLPAGMSRESRERRREKELDDNKPFESPSERTILVDGWTDREGERDTDGERQSESERELVSFTHITHRSLPCVLAHPVTRVCKRTAEE